MPQDPESLNGQLRKEAPFLHQSEDWRWSSATGRLDEAAEIEVRLPYTDTAGLMHLPTLYHNLVHERWALLLDGTILHAKAISKDDLLFVANMLNTVDETHRALRACDLGTDDDGLIDTPEPTEFAKLYALAFFNCLNDYAYVLQLMDELEEKAQKSAKRTEHKKTGARG